MNYLLTHTQLHINYEEKKLVEEAFRSKQSNMTDNDRRRGNNEKVRGSRLRFTDYFSLNAS